MSNIELVRAKGMQEGHIVGPKRAISVYCIIKQ